MTTPNDLRIHVSLLRRGGGVAPGGGDASPRIGGDPDVRRGQQKGGPRSPASLAPPDRTRRGGASSPAARPTERFVSIAELVAKFPDRFADRRPPRGPGAHPGATHVRGPAAAAAPRHPAASAPVTPPSVTSRDVAVTDPHVLGVRAVGCVESQSAPVTPLRGTFCGSGPVCADAGVLPATPVGTPASDSAAHEPVPVCAPVPEALPASPALPSGSAVCAAPVVAPVPIDVPAPVPVAVPAVSPPASVAAPPRPAPVDPPSAWQRLCGHRWVRSALVVAKLGADCLDLLGACIVAPITGRPLLRAVVRNFRQDWATLCGRTGAGAAAAATTAPAADASPEELGLVGELRAMRNMFKGTRAELSEKTLRRSCWSRGLILGAALAAIGVSGAMVAFNPAIGGAMVVLSAYAARQAYANWRQARDNLHAFREGRPTAAMGANALGQTLLEAYLADPASGLSPSQAQDKAASRSAAVGLVTLAASATVVTTALTATAVHAPAVLTGLRHAVRGIQSMVTPMAEAINSYHAEDRIAGLAQSGSFDPACRNAWEDFFRECPARALAYRGALKAYQDQRWAPLPRRRPIMGEVLVGNGTETLDFEPLVRWTRETRRFDDLQAWFALERQADATGAGRGQASWTDHLFTDLQAVDGTRNRVRAGATASAVYATTMTGVTLGLA